MCSVLNFCVSRCNIWVMNGFREIHFVNRKRFVRIQTRKKIRYCQNNKLLSAGSDIIWYEFTDFFRPCCLYLQASCAEM